MKVLKTVTLLALVASAFAVVGALNPPQAEARLLRFRQYYSSWNYYPQRSYYYRHYYYQPYASYTGYKYHYCIHYPSTPRYVYYYNPYRRVYWGRYDLESKGYSLLAEKDRNGDLKQIPETAFPKPGAMPAVPESDGSDQIDAPPNDLPKPPTPPTPPTPTPPPTP